MEKAGKEWYEKRDAGKYGDVSNMPRLLGAHRKTEKIVEEVGALYLYSQLVGDSVGTERYHDDLKFLYDRMVFEGEARPTFARFLDTWVINEKDQFCQQMAEWYFINYRLHNATLVRDVKPLFQELIAFMQRTIANDFWYSQAKEQAKEDLKQYLHQLAMLQQLPDDSASLLHAEGLPLPQDIDLAAEIMKLRDQPLSSPKDSPKVDRKQVFANPNVSPFRFAFLLHFFDHIL